MTLIDAHGPDHGLAVEVNGTEVEIRQWAELCEPDHNDELHPHIQKATIELETLLDPTGRHRGTAGRDRAEHTIEVGEDFDEETLTPEQQQVIIDAALSYLGYFGGSEEPLEEGETPCQYFGWDWGHRQTMCESFVPECRECGAKGLDYYDKK